MRSVIALNGPVSVGKTTLGRALARELGATFVDSDDLRDAPRRWVDEVLSAADRLVLAGIETLAGCPILVVAMPLRARLGVPARGFRAEGAAAFCATLAADEDAILAPGRGRAFSGAERGRVAEMIAQGYADRPFRDFAAR